MAEDYKKSAKSLINSAFNKKDFNKKFSNLTQEDKLKAF